MFRYLKSGGLVAIMALCPIWTQIAAAASPAASGNPHVTFTGPLAHLPQAELGLKLRPFTRFTDVGISFDKAGALAAGNDPTEVESIAAMYHDLNVDLSSQGFLWEKLASERAEAQTRLIPNDGIGGDATGSGDFWWWRIS